MRRLLSGRLPVAVALVLVAVALAGVAIAMLGHSQWAAPAATSPPLTTAPSAVQPVGDIPFIGDPIRDLTIW